MLVVVFDRPANYRRLGTIIRSCDALRVDGIVITGHSVDLYDPETISATTGSFFTVPGSFCPPRKSCCHRLRRFSTTITAEYISVGSDEDGDCELTEYDFTRPTLLVVGDGNLGDERGVSRIVRYSCEYTY